MKVALQRGGACLENRQTTGRGSRVLNKSASFRSDEWRRVPPKVLVKPVKVLVKPVRLLVIPFRQTTRAANVKNPSPGTTGERLGYPANCLNLSIILHTGTHPLDSNARPSATQTNVSRDDRRDAHDRRLGDSDDVDVVPASDELSGCEGEIKPVDRRPTNA